MNDEIEILPTIGEALSLKNAKNRVGNESLNNRDFNTKKYKGLLSVKDLELTCWNIIKHPRVFEYQKKIAQQVLAIIHEEKTVHYSKNISIQTIAKGLRNKK